MGKILESLVLNRINKYIESKKLLPIYQTGFRRGKATTINLKRLYNAVYAMSARGRTKRMTAAIMFDAKKAFDCVWHEGLIVKMMEDGFPIQIIQFINNWLTGRSVVVKVNKTYSRKVEIRAGVPQGSVLSSAIWNYYIGDCPTTTSAFADLAFYADDLVIWVKHSDKQKTIDILQEEVYKITKWLKD